MAALTDASLIQVTTFCIAYIWPSFS